MFIVYQNTYKKLDSIIKKNSDTGVFHMWETQTRGWYALFVATGQEERVKKNLECLLGDEINFVIPTRQLKERKAGQWHQVRRKLFPGYILLKGIMTEEIYYKIKKAPGLVKILRDEAEPLQISEREIHMYTQMFDEEGNIGVSALYKSNDKIRVMEGPLMGQEGLIDMVIARKGRAKVKLQFLGEERIVELGIQVIDKI